MSTLWFGIMNTINDDPDWSDSDCGEDEFDSPKVERAYSKIERITEKKPKRFDDFSWLKPPESMD